MKTGGRVFATPRRAPLVAQQVEIAALHQLHASAHKANGAVAQVMRLPAGTGRGACVAEQSRRNDAIGLASKAPIKRTQRKTKAMTPLVCQPIRRTDAWAADNETPEAQCCVGACGEISIERDDDCGGKSPFASPMSTAGRRLCPSSTSQYSPSAARRANAGVSTPIRLAFLKASGTGATRTAFRSRCTSQTMGALSARRCGLIAKS